MRDHSNCKRQFTQLSKAWYGDVCLRDSDTVDELTIGFYHEEGGTTGEFQITWEPLAGKVTPRLHAFDDAWDALWEFRDVLKKLAKLDDTNPSIEQVIEILLECGVENNTPTVMP